jgi:predicted nucleic acid-binding protein
VIVVDTTVLLYAVGGDHPLRQPSVRLIEAIRGGSVRATTTIEVIQEFAHAFARRRDRREAGSLGRAWAALLSPLISTTRDDLVEGLTLYENHSGLGAFDAVLAAATLAREAEALISADRAFALVSGLRHVDPATPAFDELVAL